MNYFSSNKATNIQTGSVAISATIEPVDILVALLLVVYPVSTQRVRTSKESK